MIKLGSRPTTINLKIWDFGPTIELPIIALSEKSKCHPMIGKRNR